MNVKKITVFILIFIFAIFVILFTGCTVKKERTLLNDLPSTYSPGIYHHLIKQGDSSFSKMHLYGWHRAEEFYSKAYNMKPSPELKEKRLTNLCLIAIREKHEKIVNPAVYETIDTLGNIPENQKLEYLLEIVRHYRTLPVIRQANQRIAAKEKREIDASLFDMENSALDTYLYLTCLNYFSYNLKAPNHQLNQILNNHKIFQLMDRYALSPLFIYSNFNKVADREKEIEQLFPDFAEYLVYKGNKLVTYNRLKEASRYYEKALELIPRYTKAINGIGNIYYFTIYDYETAISYYQRTLDIDPLNPMALFGKGVSLHNLERYSESNQVLDFMLANQDLYHGQVYYYKAYNQYQMQNPGKAREFVDQAKKLLQISGEASFLSGLLYYQQNNLKAAENDFLSALYDHEFLPCYPLYYLGMIKAKRNDWSFFKDFSDSIRNFEKAIANMTKRIAKIDSLNIENNQKEWMKKRQNSQLLSFKKASDKVIQQMNSIMAQNIDKKKAHDLKRKNEALTRVKTLLEKDPGIINRVDPKKEGSTLLHEAVQNNQMEVVELLLSKGASMKIKDNNGYTPLNWAVLMGHDNMVRLFINKGADINQTGADGMTLLHDAAYNGNREIVKMLLKKNAAINAKNRMGKTPLDLAVETNQKAVIPLLKPLHKSVAKGDMEEIRHNLKKYPHQLNARDENGRSPLHLAAMRGDRDIARFLLDQGSDINARDIDGFTPLELARQNNRPEMTTFLQNQGALPSNKIYLEKELNENQAILWYLGGQGLAVKTKNHFLIFDYQPIPIQLKKMPKTPLLANGQINPNELENQNIFVFLLKEVLETGTRGIDIVLSKTKATYISNNFARKGPQYIEIKHHEKKKVDGIEITAFNSPNEVERTGFLLQVDGLVIFYPGNRGYWSPSVWEDFRSEIEYLLHSNSEENATPRIDIAFLSLHENFRQKEPQMNIAKHLGEIANRLNPKLLILMPPEGEEDEVPLFKEKIEKNLKSNIKVLYGRQRGDRFFYH